MALDRVMRERLSVFGIQNVDCGWFSELQEASGLKNKLSLHYTFGRESWHGLIATAKDDGKTSVATAIPWKITTKPADQTIAHASDEKAAVIIPAKRFAAAGGTAVGTMVHELMEKIIWIDPAEWNAGEFCQKNLPDSPFAAAAEHIFCRAMAPDSEIYAVLCAPEAGGEVEVWNERRFLVTLPNGKNYSGAFDRVVVYYQNAVPVKAEIFDWKSDDLAAPEAFLSYSGQLQIYREVLAHILALPESAVTASICALKLQKVIKVW